MVPLIDLTGCKFGRLTVIERAPQNRYSPHPGKPSWVCKCDCGREKVIAGEPLRNGDTTSCGCYGAEVTSARMKALWAK